MQLKRFVSTFIVLFILFSNLFANISFADNHSEIEEFIERMYVTCLGRNSDANGLSFWVNQVESGNMNGCDIARGFVYSYEFQNMNLSNEDYVDAMYHAFFGREADNGGKTFWLNQIANGLGRDYVFNGFVYSPEFCTLCDSFGIPCNSSCKVMQQTNINAFIERMYVTCLSRQSDSNGKTYWVNLLLDGSVNGVQAAYFFMFSPEYVNSNKSDEEFVKDLYRVFMGREYDQGGYEFWLSILKQGFSRQYVFNGFSNSAEFGNICRQYGISQGIGNYGPIMSAGSSNSSSSTNQNSNTNTNSNSITDSTANNSSTATNTNTSNNANTNENSTIVSSDNSDVTGDVVEI